MSRTWKSRAAAIAISATMVVPALALASSASAVDANAAAKASCKDEGWKTLSRLDGTTFKNQGGCVSYAAQGGTPTLPLPDLVPIVSCDVQSGAIVCNMSVKNIGAAPATGVIGTNLQITASPSGGCNLSGGASLFGFAPGDVLASLGCSSASWTSVSVHAGVDTTNTIVESNEANNTLDTTFTPPA